MVERGKQLGWVRIHPGRGLCYLKKLTGNEY
jgi:hypothetical protein